MTRRCGHRPDMVEEHSCATTEDHDPVMSKTDTSVQSGTMCDVGISKDLYATNESTWSRNPCASGNLKSSGEVTGTSNARSLTTNVNESVQQPQPPRGSKRTRRAGKDFAYTGLKRRCDDCTNVVKDPLTRSQRARCAAHVSLMKCSGKARSMVMTLVKQQGQCGSC